MLRWRLHRTYESFKPLRNNPEIPAFNRVLEQVRALTFAPKFRRAQPYLTGATRPSMVHTINLQAPRTCRKLVSEEFAPGASLWIADHKMLGKNLRFVCISRDKWCALTSRDFRCERLCCRYVQIRCYTILLIQRFLARVSHCSPQQRKQIARCKTKQHNKLDSAFSGHIMEKPHSIGEI